MTVEKPYKTRKAGYETCDACLDDFRADIMCGIGAVALCPNCWNEIEITGLRRASIIASQCELRPSRGDDINYRSGQAQARDYIIRAIIREIETLEGAKRH